MAKFSEAKRQRNKQEWREADITKKVGERVAALARLRKANWQARVFSAVSNGEISDDSRLDPCHVFFKIKPPEAAEATVRQHDALLRLATL